MSGSSDNLSIVVVGASGDLARKKIFPAFFALYCQGFLPSEFRVYGLARTPMTHEEFRRRVEEKLTCRHVPGEACDERMREFLSRCYYQQGEYGSVDSMLELFQLVQSQEGPVQANRLFYLAIPPSVFMPVARALGSAGFVQCGENDPWSRVVVEKPFGRDRASSDALAKELAQVFSENQTYRIDHYLGKEVVQNLLVLRFANAIFEPLWNRRHVAGVEILWKEDIGVEGRGGYFDEYGIIRDVMQNHLLQILALVGMEAPATLSSHEIRNEKVRFLHAVQPVAAGDLVIGQYAEAERHGRQFPAYRSEPGVSVGSRTPTYGAALLKVENERWAGVPFLIRAGKGTDERKTEIRIRFRAPAGNVFCGKTDCPLPNELVVRVQPDEAVYLSVTNKVPGLSMKLASRHLDLTYKAAFSEVIPDAYESLLLDVMRGERSLFIRRDELQAAWDVFTPALHALEREALEPEPYPWFTDGPPGAKRLLSRAFPGA